MRGRRVAVVLTVLVFFFLSHLGVCRASETATPLIAHGDPVALPSVTRVVIGFLLTAALAIGAAYVLRRFSPRLALRGQSGEPVRILSQTNVHTGLRLHLVEIQGEQVLIAESKTGIALLPMSRQTSAPLETRS